mmetsp:Transcript_5315/g.8323  ORF Transcript_5315/g.8323 Transcript_5315/m.8323 type:complete len:80 (-) Transcript_5315:2941-3180(-)
MPAGYTADQSAWLKLETDMDADICITMPMNVATKPSTKTLFIMSTLDVPAIANDAKQLANSNEPTVGEIVVVSVTSFAT